MSIGQRSTFTLVVKGLERVVNKRLLVRTVFIYLFIYTIPRIMPIPGTARSKAWFCDRLLAFLDCGFESCRRHGYLPLAKVV